MAHNRYPNIPACERYLNDMGYYQHPQDDREPRSLVWFHREIRGLWARIRAVECGYRVEFQHEGVPRD